MAAELRRATDVVLATVEGCDHTGWRRIAADDGRTVAVPACPIAVGYEHGMTWIQTILAGEPLPSLAPDAFDTENAADAVRFADVAKPEVLAMLREQGNALIDLVAGFSDADLGQ